MEPAASVSVVLRRAAYWLFTTVFSALFGTRVARAVWSVPGSRRLYRAIMTRLAPDLVLVDEHRMRLDPLDSLLLSVNASYEQFERSVFDACIRTGDVVVDVGAHIGLYTLTAARATGPTGRVIAFEPSSANIALLRENVAMNGYTNVEPVASAVSDRVGRASLALSQQNTGDNSLVAQVGHGTAETVDTVTLDVALAERGLVVDVLKMDVQGGEPLVLDGAGATVGSRTDLIVFTEISPAHLGGVPGAVSYAGRLVDLGFELLEVDERTSTLRPLDVVEVASASARAGHDGHVNVVCVRGGSRARLAGFVSVPTP